MATLVCMALLVPAASAQTNRVSITYFTSLKDSPGLAIGLLDPVTNAKTPTSPVAVDGGWKFDVDVTHPSGGYYNETSLYFEFSRLGKENSLAQLLEKKSRVEALLPLRFRAGEESTTRSFELRLPERYGFDALDQLELLTTSDGSQRNRILAKFLAGWLGFSLLANTESKQRRWARIRWDGMIQLAKTENGSDLILPSLAVKDEYSNIISDKDRKDIKIDGEMAWLMSRYFKVDDLIVRRELDAGRCPRARSVLDAMKKKNEASSDADRKTQRPNDTQDYFPYTAALIRNCEARTGA